MNLETTQTKNFILKIKTRGLKWEKHDAQGKEAHYAEG